MTYRFAQNEQIDTLRGEVQYTLIVVVDVPITSRSGSVLLLSFLARWIYVTEAVML